MPVVFMKKFCERGIAVGFQQLFENIVKCKGEVEMKKMIALLLALVLSTGSLIGCGGNTESAEEDKTGKTAAVEKEQTDESRTVTIYSSKDDWKDQCAYAAQLIEEKYNIKVDVITQPRDESITVISTKLATNDPPDIFMATAPTSAYQFNAPETCEVLDEEPWVERLTAEKLLRYSADNHIYAMPAFNPVSFLGGIYYNKERMKELGYENPHPKTMDEFWGILEDIKSQGVTPVYTTDADAWTTQVWTTVGWAVAMDEQKDTIYDEFQTNKKKFAEVPEMIEILQQLQYLHDKGYSNENHASQTYDTAKAAIASGEYPMVISGDFFENAFHAEYPDVELGSFAIPFKDKDMIATGCYTCGMWVPKGDNSELAKEYLSYWSSPEIMSEVYKKYPLSSAWKDVDGGDVLPAQKNLNDNYVATGQFTYEFDGYFEVSNSIISSYLMPGIVEVTMGKDPKQMLEEWDEQFSSFMKDKEMPGF